MFDLIAVTLEELMILTAKSDDILKDDCKNPMLTSIYIFSKPSNFVQVMYYILQLTEDFSRFLLSVSDVL